MDPLASLSIIRLSSNITGTEDAGSGAKRASDISADSSSHGDMTPGSLAVDLVHYKVRNLWNKSRRSVLIYIGTLLETTLLVH